jgi:hypothetical protein
MSKLKRKRKQDRIRVRLESSIIACQAIIDSHPQPQPTPEQIEVERIQGERLRAIITPEYIENMNAVSQRLHEINEWHIQFAQQLKKHIASDYKKTHGAIPGSTRTKRLRKKREKMVFRTDFKRASRRELDF